MDRGPFFYWWQCQSHLPSLPIRHRYYLHKVVDRFIFHFRFDQALWQCQSHLPSLPIRHRYYLHKVVDRFVAVAERNLLQCDHERM